MSALVEVGVGEANYAPQQLDGPVRSMALCLSQASQRLCFSHCPRYLIVLMIWGF